MSKNDSDPGAVTVDFVFADDPSGVTAFVEVEVDGKSIRFGKWVRRADGYCALRITKDDLLALENLR